MKMTEDELETSITIIITELLHIIQNGPDINLKETSDFLRWIVRLDNTEENQIRPKS